MTVTLEGLENPFEVKTNNTESIQPLNVSPGSVKKHLADLSLDNFAAFDGALDVGDRIIPDSVTGRVEVEIGNTEHVPLSWLNRLRQTRQEYDAEKIVALAKSIETVDRDGRKKLKLLGPLQVVVCDDDELVTYLADHEEYYGEKTDPESLVRGGDGLWHLVDAGHRRSLAFEYLCMIYDISPDDLDVPNVPLRGMTFDEAKGIQSRENEYDRPPIIDEAEDIARFFKFRQRRQNTMPTYRQIAEAYGTTQKKVSNALRFSELPDEVQLEVKKGHVTWTNSLHLHQYMRCLQVHYPEKYQLAYADPESDRTAEQDVTHEMMTVIKHLRSQELDKKSATQKTEYINSKIRAIRDAMDNDALFELAFEPTPAERRQRAETALAKKAINIARQTIDNMVLSADAVDELYDLQKKIDGILGAHLKSVTEDSIFDLEDELILEPVTNSVA